MNRIFAKYASKIALSFRETSGIAAEFFAKTIFTGNPVRQEILELHEVEYKLPDYQKVEKKADNKMGYDVLLASDFYEAATEEERNFFNILIMAAQVEQGFLAKFYLRLFLI